MWVYFASQILSVESFSTNKFYSLGIAQGACRDVGNKFDNFPDIRV